MSQAQNPQNVRRFVVAKCKKCDATAEIQLTTEPTSRLYGEELLLATHRAMAKLGCDCETGPMDIASSTREEIVPTTLGAG